MCNPYTCTWNELHSHHHPSQREQVHCYFIIRDSLWSWVLKSIILQKMSQRKTAGMKACAVPSTLTYQPLAIMRPCFSSLVNTATDHSCPLARAQAKVQFIVLFPLAGNQSYSFTCIERLVNKWAGSCCTTAFHTCRKCNIYPQRHGHGHHRL